MNNFELKITNEQKHISQPKALTERYSDEEKTRLAKTAKEFESLLTSMMLKSMNETSGGMFGSEGYGGEYFDSIFENQMASHMSKGKGFGVADVIYKKLTGEELSTTLLNGKSIDEIRADLKVKINKSTDALPFLTPGEKSVQRVTKFDNYIKEAASKYGLDENLIKSVILTESAGNPRAVSSAKAKGLMQLMDGTARDMGVSNSFDPKQNIMGGAKYLSELFRKYDGDIQLTLAAYNAGPANVEKYEGIPPFNETKTYVTRVMGYLNFLNG